MKQQIAVVFDDDDLFRSLFTRILREKGFKVTTYSDPSLYFCSHPSIKTCPVETPCVDFLLSDNKMPEMTGLEFLERIKQMGCKIPDKRKAIVSGSLENGEQQKAMQLTSNVFDKSDAKEKISFWIEESK
jgi:CheY-like chemotaxis protein